MLKNYKFDGEIKMVDRSDHLQMLVDAVTELNEVIIKESQGYVVLEIANKGLGSFSVFINLKYVKNTPNFELFTVAEKRVLIEGESHSFEDKEQFNGILESFFNREYVKGFIQNVVIDAKDVIKKFEEEKAGEKE